MRKFTKIHFIVLLFMPLFLSCSSKETVGGGSGLTGQAINLDVPIPRTFKQNAIKIHINADKLLNFYDDSPHTLMLVVYQLKNINFFKQATKDKDSLTKITDFNNLDSSIVGYDKIFIEPAETKTVELDRRQEAQFIGIVAFYYNYRADLCTKVYQFPVSVEKKGIWGFRKTVVNVEDLEVKLYFDAYSIQEVK